MKSRDRKNLLITVLKAKGKASGLTQEQSDRFELMYRQARTPEEQDQVTKALDAFLEGWKHEPDVFSRLLRDVHDFGDDVIGQEDDEDPPALKEALARSQVTFLRRPV